MLNSPIKNSLDSMKHYSTYQSQFIEMFEGDKYPRISLDAIADEWLKGQAFKKDEICENGDKHCIHYGELFTKYGPVIKEVVSKTSVDLKKPSKNGDILFPASDVTPNGLARCSMLPYDNVVLGGDIIVLRPKDGYSPAYLSYAINQQTTQLLARVNGGLVKHLSAKGLKTVEIPIPSKEKQEEYIRIAEQADKSKFTSLKSQFIEMFWGGKYTMKKLRGHIEVLRGVSYKPSDVHEDLSDNTSIVLRSNNIDGGQVNFDDLVYVDSERVSEHQVLNAGDIVMCGSNGSKKLVGKAALLNETPRENTSFGAFCLGIRCKSSIIPEYLATYFQTSLYRDKIEALGSGSNILNIKPDHIYDLEIPIPSLGEQEMFVSIVKQAEKSKYIN